MPAHFLTKVTNMQSGCENAPLRAASSTELSTASVDKDPGPPLPRDGGPDAFDQFVDESALPIAPRGWAGGRGIGPAQCRQLAKDVDGLAE